MKTKTSIVIIGGGVMGVSLLYHLAKRGWKDLVLLEKNELTAGSTWHAAGLCTHFAHNATIMEMRSASVRLYKDILPEETGESAGFHPCGALRITRSEERMLEFKQVQGLGKFVGYDFHLLSPQELKEIYPLTETDEIIGAIYEPQDGHVDPTMATNAMASRAKAMGADVYRHCPVQAIEKLDNGWKLTTAKGEIHAEQIVNAAGTWCREIGSMMGVELPVVPMLHQYVVMDSVADIVRRIETKQPELPIIRDPEESWYVRQERDGFIIGPYEKDGMPWSIDGIPKEFGMELLPPDLDRIENIMLKAMQRIPALTSAGIKTVVNGPITFTPDANPLIGPAYNLDNAWLLTGSSMGVMEGGGAGKFLADWISDDSPPSDALAIDSRRFGEFADKNYRVEKAVEGFGLQFGVHYPFEEREAGRPCFKTAIYAEQKNAGAVFGFAYGFERPNWFARIQSDASAPLTFRRPAWFDAVRAECIGVMNSVGLTDMSAFSKLLVTGQDAAVFMDSLGANSAPNQDGSIRLTHALTPAGGIASEFSITRRSPQHFYLVSAAAARRHDLDLLRSRSAEYKVSIEDVTERFSVIGIMGPQAERLMQSITGSAFNHNLFPWLTAQYLDVADIKIMALRVSYVGESGWELHVKPQDMSKLHHLLMRAGEEFELIQFGAYAMNSMRLEKGYKAWGMDLTTERSPLESGLDPFVKTDARSFIGKDCLMKRNAPELKWSMVLLELDAQTKNEIATDPFAAHTVMQTGKPVGIVTSGGWGHRTNTRLALAYLKPGISETDGYSVIVLDQEISARVLAQPPYDPLNKKMRGSA